MIRCHDMTEDGMKVSFTFIFGGECLVLQDRRSGGGGGILLRKEKGLQPESRGKLAMKSPRL